MDGQIYDEAMAPLQQEQTEAMQRPSSSDSDCARIGAWTSDERDHRTDGENEIDIKQLITASPQARPNRACLSLECNGDCPDCTPTVLSYDESGLRRQDAKPKQQLSSPPTLPSPPRNQLPQQQQRRQQPSPRPQPQPRQHQRRNSHLRQSDFYVPRISSPLRHAQVSSPQRHQPPSPQVVPRLPSPRPDSAEVSPLTPPPRSPLRDETMSPVSFTMPFGRPDPEPVANQITAYDTEDPAIDKALREAEEQNGAPLLPWDVETIKASMERRPRPRLVPAKPAPFVYWHKDHNANRAASESSTTALAILLKTLSGMPQEAQQKMGIVGISSVRHKRPQPSPPATITTFDESARSACKHVTYDSLSQRANMYEEDGPGVYTTSWPESSYYFERRASITEQLPASVQMHSTVRSGVRGNNGNGQSRPPAQQPYVQQSAERHQARHQHQW
ncbi:hypothetical protein SEUCBS139899_006236 [Sporothrix eucalyptigena]